MTDVAVEQNDELHKPATSDEAANQPSDEALDTESDEDESAPGDNSQTEEFRQKAIASASDLMDLLSNLRASVERVEMALGENLFQGFSKETRNELMTNIIEDSREIEAVARVLFRNLKKVKKVNMSNEQRDTLILKYLTVKQNVPQPAVDQD